MTTAPAIRPMTNEPVRSLEMLLMHEELARARIRELQQEGERAALAAQLAAARRRRRRAARAAQRRWRALLVPAR